MAGRCGLRVKHSLKEDQLQMDSITPSFKGPQQIEIGDNLDLKITTTDLSLLLRNKEKTQNSARAFGRDLMKYFFGDRPCEFWQQCLEDARLKESMSNARKSISGFVKDTLGFNVTHAISCFVNEKRRLKRDAYEREKLLHVCSKCNRRCKDARHRLSHEKNCGGRKKRIIRCDPFPRALQLKIAENKKKLLEQKIITGYQLGLEMRVICGKSRAVMARRTFRKGSFVCTYAGETLPMSEGIRREAIYSKQGSGCYIYFFEFTTTKLCVDATAETSSLGRLINHSKKKQNLKPKIASVNGEPFIVFYALRDIKIGEELLYDYADSRRTAREDFPWLKY